MKYKQPLSKIVAVTFGLLVCFAISFILPIAHSYAAIDEAGAKELMYKYCTEQLGFSKSDLELYNFLCTDEGEWAFSLRVKDADSASNGLVIGTMENDGKLLFLEGPKSISAYLQLYETWLKSERSYEAMYKMKSEWEPKLDYLSIEDIEELELHESIFPFVAFIKHDVRLPSEEFITYEEAKQNAKDAILAIKGWTPEMFNLIKIKLEVFHVPVNSNNPVYEFVYGPSSTVGHIEALYSGKSYAFDYEKASKDETRLFGESLPCVVNVRIDAQTGEVIGKVYIEVPPMSDGVDLKYVLMPSP